MVLLEELQERPIKQRASKGKIIERLLFDCPLENAGSWTRESIDTSGYSFERKKYSVRFYNGFHLDDKIGHVHGAFTASFTTICISFNNTNLIIASFPIQLPNIYGRSLKLQLPIAIDKGKTATISTKDYSAYNSVLVLDMAAEPSSNQQHHQNLLASVGDSEVTRFSDISSFRSCLVNTLKSNTRGDKIHKQVGVGKFKDLTKNDFNFSAVHVSRNEKGRSRLNTNAALKVKKEHVLLPAATLLATVLFTVACRFPRFITKANYIYDYDTGRIVQVERDSTITSSFILFNSTGFILSLAIVISILRGFPLKPWPQISVSMLFGSYMCLIMKILPLESFLVLFLSVPLLLLAAAGKLCNFSQ